ncbi:2-C-methyl-D-erythritol 4-phosphate cytidylyltransferase [Arthrobacter crystallopoietes]|uniref:2-C-methyl-D-erythritol 4-phosphate cytidylyltransferase n=1 Tax=Crystallibacter crystallopoietes TaxID=37928 RepID=A0A1H1BGL9_9MICC|nr:2-C-methyl-D-erythritol 4-phosphate cytidylyltransferase [Arthrobacter crystallopoietes]SDQ51031.1 2-C-methyl-D-erythritol 4-phosphate cytidylyltransferase [Arthrobacter crystallopoietes]
MPRSSTPRIGVVVVAAGSGQRLGYGLPKAQVPLAGRTILAHALEGILASGIAERICVAVPPRDSVLREVCTGASGQVPVTAVEGGASRAASVSRALAGLGPDLDGILVHDAARALTPPEVFVRVVEALAAGAKAVIPAVPVADTIKTAVPSAADQQAIAGEKVAGTPDRSLLRAVQTPQGFDAAALTAAHRSLAAMGPLEAEGITDDAMLVESQGTEVFLVPGSPEALKITTPLDLMTAEALVAARDRTGPPATANQPVPTLED